MKTICTVLEEKDVFERSKNTIADIGYAFIYNQGYSRYRFKGQGCSE
jgi:hypothetical protein